MAHHGGHPHPVGAREQAAAEEWWREESGGLTGTLTAGGGKSSGAADGASAQPAAAASSSAEEAGTASVFDTSAWKSGVLEDLEYDEGEDVPRVVEYMWDYGDVAGGLGLSLDHSASFTTTHVAVRSRVEDAPLRPEMQSSLHAVPPVRPRQGSLSAVAPSMAGSAQAATASPSRQSLDFRRGSMGSTRADPQTAVSVTPPVATRPAAVSAAGVAQPRVLGAHAHQHAYQQQRVQQREEQLRRVTAALHRVAPRTPSANGGPKDPQYV